MTRLLDAFVQPPLNCLTLGGVGLLLRLRWRRLGNLALVIAGLGLWLFATPLFSSALLVAAQRYPPLPAGGERPDAQAIVVLSADHRHHAPELREATLGPLALERIRYAAMLQRETGRPLLVSGGIVGDEPRSHAAMMREVLENEFGVPVRWMEDRSRNTFENARFSAEILRRDGITRIYLVTHAWHLPRAAWSFEHHGMEVVGAPTAFSAMPRSVLTALLPRWQAVRDGALAIHEWLGLAWYVVTHG